MRVRILWLCFCDVVAGLASRDCSRRNVLGWIGAAGGATILAPSRGWAESGALKTPDSLDIDSFLSSGGVAQPMGVSGQAGKSRPETGVVLRDGSEVDRDSRTGDVLAEIIVDSSSGKVPILASYSSPWPLAKGTVFDVECRDASTGDGAFLQVSSNVGGKSIEQLKDSFFLDQLLAPTGRFSFYGPPTDVKILKSSLEGDYRTIDLKFSTVSQATQTEIPRRARLTATIPEGSAQAVMLIASSSSLRWKKGSEKAIASTIESFRAFPAPSTSLSVRGKERGRP